MKLPDFLEYQPFNQLRQQMGTDTLGDFHIFDPDKHLSGMERHQLQTGGIEFDGVELDINALRILADQTSAYKNSRILWLKPNTEAQESLFHFAACPAFASAQEFNQPLLIFTHIEGLKLDELGLSKPPKICHQCLQTCGYQGYDEVKNRKREYSKKILADFKLSEFFHHYPRHIDEP